MASQLIARQRDLAGRALHVAGPFVTDGVAKLTQVVGTLQDVRKSGRTGTAPQAVTADEVAAPVETAHVDTTPAEAGQVQSAAG